MPTIAIGNLKGGTGKTTTARTLSALLSRHMRVLAVDCDPQAALTAMFGAPAGATLADVLGGAAAGSKRLADVLLSISPSLSLAPAGIELAASEVGMVSRIGRENVLRKALATVAGFDVIMIDCPPALGLLSLNALVAADAVLIPVIPSATDVRALKAYLDTVDNVREELNPALEVAGIVPTMFDSRTTHHTEVIQAMEAAGLPVWPTAIGRSVKVQEASAAGESIVEYDEDNQRANEYKQLARELETWLKRRQLKA